MSSENIFLEKAKLWLPKIERMRNNSRTFKQNKGKLRVKSPSFINTWQYLDNRNVSILSCVDEKDIAFYSGGAETVLSIFGERDLGTMFVAKEQQFLKENIVSNFRVFSVLNKNQIERGLNYDMNLYEYVYKGDKRKRFLFIDYEHIPSHGRPGIKKLFQKLESNLKWPSKCLALTLSFFEYVFNKLELPWDEDSLIIMEATRKGKASFHITWRNIIFPTHADEKIFRDYLEAVISTCEDCKEFATFMEPGKDNILIPKYAIDLVPSLLGAVSTQMRMINQSKLGKPESRLRVLKWIPNVPLNFEHTLWGQYWDSQNICNPISFDETKAHTPEALQFIKNELPNRLRNGEPTELWKRYIEKQKDWKSIAIYRFKKKLDGYYTDRKPDLSTWEKSILALKDYNLKGTKFRQDWHVFRALMHESKQLGVSFEVFSEFVQDKQFRCMWDEIKIIDNYYPQVIDGCLKIVYPNVFENPNAQELCEQLYEWKYKNIKTGKGQTVSNVLTDSDFENKTILMESHCGDGKTYYVLTQLQRLLKENPCSTVFLGCRIKFVEELVEKIKKHIPLLRSRDYRIHGNLRNDKHVVVELESINKISGCKAFDILVLDEIRGLRESFCSNQTTWKDTERGNEITNVFMNLVKESKKCIVMDAVLDNNIIKFFEKMRGTIFFYKHTFQYTPPETKQLFQTTLTGNVSIRRGKRTNKQKHVKIIHESTFTKRIIKCLKNGENVHIVSQSKSKAKKLIATIKEKLPGKTIKFISAETEEVITNPDEEWLVNLLVVTPAITCGISFDMEWFHKTFVWGCTGTCPMNNIYQAIMRVRHRKHQLVLFAQSSRGNPPSKFRKRLPLGENLLLRFVQRQGNDFNPTINDKLVSKALLKQMRVPAIMKLHFFIPVWNEISASDKYPVELFCYLMQRQDFVVDKSEQNNLEHEVEVASVVDKILFDDIPYSIAEAERLEKMKKHRQILTKKESNILDLHYYLMFFNCEYKNVTTEIKEYWNLVYSNKYKRAILDNMRLEKTGMIEYQKIKEKNKGLYKNHSKSYSLQSVLILTKILGIPSSVSSKPFSLNKIDLEELQKCHIKFKNETNKLKILQLLCDWNGCDIKQLGLKTIVYTL